MAVFAASVASGCSVSVDFGGDSFRCDEEPKLCPDGRECLMGRCVVPGSTPDATPDGNSETGGFSTPTRIEGLSALMADDDDVSFSADRLFVAFNSNRGGGGDIWSSTRASIDDEWTEPVLEQALSSADQESTVGVSADGLSVVFGSNRTGSLGGRDVYLSTRDDRDAPWSTPINVTSLNSTATDAANWISNDHSLVLLDSRRDGESRLYVATLASSGDYDVVEISELTSGDGEFAGRFAANRLVLTFHSDRPTGVGNGDIYIAKRDSINQPFGTPTLFEDINSPALDEDAWLSDDLCYIAFTTDDENGDREIFKSRCIE